MRVFAWRLPLSKPANGWRRLKGACLIGVLAFCLLLGAAPVGAREPSVSIDKFSKKYPVVLGFDLQQDEFPQAALIVNSAPNSSGPDRNISLPFKVFDVKINERAKFRIGQYEDWTLVTFSVRDQSVWPQAILFFPRFERSFDPESSNDNGTKSVSLVAEGQIRRFRYRYPNAKSSKSFASVPGDLSIHPDAIAIALPEGAQEFAVRPGVLTMPAPLLAAERVFPAVSSDPNEQFLEINYQVPATDLQKLIVKWGVKILAAILPIAGLFFLKAEHVRNTRLRWMLLVGGSLSFFAVLVAILWAAYNSADRADIIGDLILCLGSAAISGLIFLSKNEEKSAGPPISADLIKPS